MHKYGFCGPTKPITAVMGLTTQQHTINDTWRSLCQCQIYLLNHALSKPALNRFRLLVDRSTQAVKWYYKLKYQFYRYVEYEDMAQWVLDQGWDDEWGSD